MQIIFNLFALHHVATFVFFFLGPAIVEKDIKTEPSTHEDSNPTSKISSTSSSSVSEAEEQAILCLESAIESVMDVALIKSTQDLEKDTTVTLSGSSVILSPDEEMMRENEPISDEAVSLESLPKGNT